MPELPEVETVRRSLEPALVGRTITSAKLIRRDILVVPGDPPGGFSRARAAGSPKGVTPEHLLVGARITSLRRHGKQLAIIARDGRTLLVHLGMTGAVRVNETATDHVHARWALDDGAALTFRDPRRFGGLWSLPTVEDLDRDHWSRLGPDALAITGSQLRERLREKRTAIKAALLDQAVLAGVGNIYADEALFLARIAPRTLAGSIGVARAERLAKAIRDVLSAAVEARGSRIRDYAPPDGDPAGYQLAHAVYGRAGEPCNVCSTRLTRSTIGQRTTVWCRRCQS